MAAEARVSERFSRSLPQVTSLSFLTFQDQLKNLLIFSGFPEGRRCSLPSYCRVPNLPHTLFSSECFVPYNVRVTGPDERADMASLHTSFSLLLLSPPSFPLSTPHQASSSQPPHLLSLFLSRSLPSSAWVSTQTCVSTKRNGESSPQTASLLSSISPP